MIRPVEVYLLYALLVVHDLPLLIELRGEWIDATGQELEPFGHPVEPLPLVGANARLTPGLEQHLRQPGQSPGVRSLVGLSFNYKRLT